LIKERSPQRGRRVRFSILPDISRRKVRGGLLATTGIIREK